MRTLTEPRTVQVPARYEVEMDLAQHGSISVATAAAYGAAAVKVGAPDADHNDASTNAVDAVTNILHALTAELGGRVDAESVLAQALRNYRGEQEDDAA